MRRLVLIVAVVGALVAYASAQTQSGNQECGDRMWARFSTTLEQPPDSPMRNVTFCVNNVLVKADEMQVIEKSAGVRTFALRGTVTLTVPGWETAPAK